MDMGTTSPARAHLQALIAAAAPDPLPAEQALPLLAQLGETDTEALGRIAYHALTGTEPGDGEPRAPREVVDGFPPFASEVLVRAIAGPDERRPTPQALLIVLDTVPKGSWPSAGRPFVTLHEEAAATVTEPEAAVDDVATEPVPAPP
ncbi:hypothetical protein, partial [Nocardioides sp. J9]|uniref:hypothetical protein n=1 Tax=Nocardioides sp. J9 TaxID=935844 RepID=UPI001C97BEA7